MSDEADLHNQVIRALGGKAQLARDLQIDASRLSKWHVRGIPSRYWHKVVALLSQLDPPFPMTAARLEETKPHVVAEAA